MKVTVVIPNYNGKHFLKACLDSLASQKYRDFETLIVDNASSDGSIEFIESNYKNVTLMKLDKNYGFCGGVNIGIKASKTDYVLLLNNDTEVDENFVENMVKAIEKSPKIFSVSSRMVNFYKRDIMDDAGDSYNLLGWGAQRGVGQPIKRFDKPCRVFSACGGAAIYRKSVFEEMGYFDENHFAYLEDIDIGYRAKTLGYINTYEPKAIVYHVGSGTTGSKYNSFKVKMAARNNVYVIYKNMPLLQLIINLPTLLVGYIIKMLFFVNKGFAKDYFLGLKEGLLTAKKLKKQKFQWKNIGSYIIIEFELLINTVIYFVDYVKRRIK